MRPVREMSGSQAWSAAGTLTSAALPLLLAMACNPGKIVLDDSGTGDSGDTIVNGSLSVTPASLDFGVVFVGQSKTATVTVTNVGDAEITLGAAVDGDAAYTVVLSGSPAPGASVDVAVTFTPGQIGAVTADLVLDDRAGEASVPVPLSGEAQVDADGDGHGSADSGGDDCDDADVTAHPGATEVWYDGVDQACDGGDDYDRDSDGSIYTEDCDDADPATRPGAPEVWYDGADQACDGGDDFDQDADGVQIGADCDDTDAATFPGAPDSWYDGVDSDCGFDDDYDQDRDGAVLDDDCDDTDATVFPGAPETWYDGVDSDCAGDDDYDQDLDGALWPTDCNDTDPTVTGPIDELLDGVDNDCDGVVDDVPVAEIASGVLYGPVASSGLGGAGNLAMGGDVTGDGAVDLVVSSDSTGYGYAWVVDGAAATAADGSVRDYDTAEVTGSSSAYILGNVAGPMRDVNEDGTDDLLVAGFSSYYYEGRAWLLAGGSALTGSISTGSTYTARYEGDSADDMLMWAVTGDIDGDGVVEVVTGAPYDNYVGDRSSDSQAGNVAVFSGAYATAYTLASAADQIAGAGDYDYLGYTLVIADLDADGYDDIVAGAPGLDDAATNAGGVYVVDGNASLAWADRVDDATTALRLGTAASQYLGADALSAPGDHDGDGAVDLVLHNDTAGLAWLFWDAAALAGTASVSTADVTITGAAASFGASGAFASDLDGDGADEIYVGAYGDDAAAADAGAVYRFEPPSGATGAWTTADATGVFLGASAGDALGAGLAGGADVDGDGREDLLLGATGADGGASGGGAVYVVSGR